MKIITLTEENSNIWDDFVLHSENAWFFHLSSWIKLCQDTMGLKNHSFMVLKDDNIVGIVPMALEKKKFFRFLKSPPFGGFGCFVLEKSLSEKDKEITIQLIKEYIDMVAKGERVDFYQFDDFSLVRTYVNIFKSDLDTSKTHSEYRQARFIELKKDEKILWQGIKNSAKQLIKTGQRNGLYVNEATETVDLATFYQLLKHTYRKTGAKLIPYHYYLALWQNFAKKRWVRILFANYRDEKIAAVFLLAFKNLVFYLAGASKASYIKLGPNHFLQWETILWSKRNGFDRYLIGIYNPYTTKDKEKKIEFFESRFGGDVVLFKNRIKAYNHFKYFAYNLAKNISVYVFPYR